MPHVRPFVDERPAWPAHAACGDDLSLHFADSGIEMELGGQRLGRKLNAVPVLALASPDEVGVGPLPLPVVPMAGSDGNRSGARDG